MSVEAVCSARGGARGDGDIRRRDCGLLNCPGKWGRAHRQSLINGAVEVGMETISQGGPDTHVTNVSPLFQHILI